MVLLLALAHAEGLQDGWRNIAYGPAIVVVTAPQEDCVPYTAPAVRWTCRERVWGVPVLVDYVVQEDIYTGIVMHVEGYGNCTKVREVLDAAWRVPFVREGGPDVGKLSAGTWNLGNYKTEITASWRYDVFNRRCTVATASAEIAQQVQERRAAKASAASEGGL